MGTSAPGAPHANTAGKVFQGSGELLFAALGVGTYDYDGGGIGLTDLATFAQDFFGGANPDRSDFDGNGFVSLADLRSFASAYFGGHSAAGGAVLCP